MAGRRIYYNKPISMSAYRPGNAKALETTTLLHYDEDEIVECLRQNGWFVVPHTQVRYLEDSCSYPYDNVGRYEEEMKAELHRTARARCASLLHDQVQTREFKHASGGYTVVAKQMIVKYSPEEINRWHPPAPLDDR